MLLMQQMRGTVVCLLLLAGLVAQTSAAPGGGAYSVGFCRIDGFAHNVTLSRPPTSSAPPTPEVLVLPTQLAGCLIISSLVAAVVNSMAAIIVFYVWAKPYVATVVKDETIAGRNMAAASGFRDVAIPAHRSITEYFASYWAVIWIVSTVAAVGGAILADQGLTGIGTWLIVPPCATFRVVYYNFAEELGPKIAREYNKLANTAHVKRQVEMEEARKKN